MDPSVGMMDPSLPEELCQLLIERGTRSDVVLLLILLLILVAWKSGGVNEEYLVMLAVIRLRHEKDVPFFHH